MIDPLTTGVASSQATTADPQGQGGANTSASVPAKPAATAESNPQPQAPLPTVETLRLVVEPTEGGSDFTYKLFDRATGELVLELPQSQAQKLGESSDYSAGQVLNATV